MNLITLARSISRKPGDPRLLSKGPSSLGSADRLARALGWFSIGLGLVQLITPRTITRPLGMHRANPLIRAYGLREIDSGIGALTVDPRLGIWSRVGGDAIDLGTLAVAMRGARRRHRNAIEVAMALVTGMLVIDLVCAKMLHQRHARTGTPRDYSDRSGFPSPPEQMRGAARDRARPRQHRGESPDDGARASIRPHG
jgi:hypothetical protein